MSTLEIIAKISVFVVVGMLTLWQLRRKPYRSGYPIRMTPRSQPTADTPPPHSQTVIHETHAEFIGVPCEPPQDWSGVTDALNAGRPGTDHRDQDDDNPGPSWGIIR